MKITKRQLRRIIREVATPYYDYGYSDSEQGHDPEPPDASVDPTGAEQYMAGYNAADEHRSESTYRYDQG